MKLIIAISALALGLSGCSVYREATSARPDVKAPWRAVATDTDRDRLRNWRKAWTEGLAAAREFDAAAINADPALFDPDRALADAALPGGNYRCRTFKLGGAGTAMRDFTAYPAFDCAVRIEDGVTTFHKLTGSQRPTGVIYSERPARTVFLGTLILSDETSPLRYGLDEQRNMIGYVERIGEQRWRLVFPYPHFESKLDVIELVPA